MGIAEDITVTLRQAGIDPGASAVTRSIMCRGYDYWVYKPSEHDRPGKTLIPPVEVRATVKPMTDGSGLSRTPHQYVLGREPVPIGALPILATDMNVVQLASGIWRRSMIRPGSSHEDAHEFRICNIDDDCQSATHLVALFGHQPRDLALWFDDLRLRDPLLFKLVLANDFKAALKYAPGVIQYPWPERVQDDFLPPFLVAVIYAELGMLAMNQAGLLELSFNAGAELAPPLFLDEIRIAHGPFAAVAAMKAIENAPFQTIILDPPPAIITNGTRDGIGKWFHTATSYLALATGILGDIDILPTTNVDAKNLKSLYSDHPLFPPASGAGSGKATTLMAAATFWGLNWRQNAAVRLLEIAITARDWNQEHRPNGPRLPDHTKIKTANPVAHAISSIQYNWLAEHDISAAIKLLDEKILPDDAQDFALRAAHHSGTFDELSVIDYLGEKSGLHLLQNALRIYAVLPGPEKIGYTARSQAHLWLDDIGDDIKEYRYHQSQAVYAHNEVIAGRLDLGQDTSRIPAEVVKMVGNQLGVNSKHKNSIPNVPPPKMSLDPEAARGAQLMGQRVSAFSTDPVWGYQLNRNLLNKYGTIWWRDH